MVLTRRAYQRWGRKGSTAQRGYGAAHQAERERRLRAYKPGDLCAHGGERMLWPALTIGPRGKAEGIARDYLDLPHNASRTGYLAGLSCSTHNRQEGAVRGNQQRRTVRTWQSARPW